MNSTLTHIETEKQSTGQGRRVPAIRFGSFETNWPKVDLKSVVKVNQGLAILRSNRFEKGGPNRYNYITIPYLQGGESHFIENPQESVKCKEDDVIVTRTGSGVGQIWTGVSGVFHNNFFKVLPVEDKVRKDFIYHYLLTPFVQRKMKSFAGSSAIPDLNHSEFYLLPFNLPTLPEQQKIASFLSTVDEKIQQLTKKKELLEQYKKGVMQQLFSGQLRFKDENGKPYPDWEWVGGNKLFDNISDKKHNSDLQILAITQDQGAIPRELINYKMTVTDASVASYKVVQKGDFIISLRTFQGGIEFSEYHGICSPAYNILRPSSEDVDRTFYKFYLKTSFYIRQLQKNLEGIRDGKMISYKYFSEIKVPFPSYPEQKKIARYLSGIDTKIEAVNNCIIQTQTFKKGLLQQMFV